MRLNSIAMKDNTPKVILKTRIITASIFTLIVISAFFLLSPNNGISQFFLGAWEWGLLRFKINFSKINVFGLILGLMNFSVCAF